MQVQSGVISQDLHLSTYSLSLTHTHTHTQQQQHQQQLLLTARSDLFAYQVCYADSDWRYFLFHSINMLKLRTQELVLEMERNVRSLNWKSLALEKRGR
jgi:hypothetical protein